MTISLKKYICSEQFGFRSCYSTELAALQLIDQIISHLDAGRIPLNIYLSKAFDTLDHISREIVALWTTRYLTSTNKNVFIK